MASTDRVTLTCKECGVSETDQQIYLAGAGWKLVTFKYNATRKPYHLCPKHAAEKEEALLAKKAARRQQT